MNNEVPLCACGCGECVKWNKQYKRWNKFIAHHHTRTKEYKDRASKAHKKRYKENPELAKATSKRQKKYSHFHVYNKTKEHSENVKKSNSTRIITKEQKRKTSETLKGRKLSDETKLKISITLRDNESKRGKNNSAWKGGISPRREIGEWIKISREIKKRDNFICQNCGSKKNLDVHHKDFDKNNHEPLNLITFCRKCHKRIHIEHKKSLKN